MDTAQWPQQEIVMKPMKEMVVTNTCTTKLAGGTVERKARPQKEQALNCPRCNSTNTKFCYYNNYSLTQPRYFCKTCRRYWTEGGSLRNIPVGGGSRKNRRSASSSSSSSNPSSSSSHSSMILDINNKNYINKLPDLMPSLACSQSSTTQIPNSIHDQGQDLNLGFPGIQDFRNMSELLQVPNIENKAHIPSTSAITSPAASSHQHLSALELLTGFTSRGLDNSFVPPMLIPDQSAVYSSSGFPMQEFKPTLNFSLDGSLGRGYGGQDASRRPPFPYEDLKQVSSTGDVQQSREAATAADLTGYWTGMIGGGSW